jgi:NAD-dependent DNA ligase
VQDDDVGQEEEEQEDHGHRNDDEEEEEEEEMVVEKKLKKTKQTSKKSDKEESSGGGSGSLAGKTVVLTGALSTRRTDMVRLLKQAGAKIGSGVSKNTDILIAGDKVLSQTTRVCA